MIDLSLWRDWTREMLIVVTIVSSSIVLNAILDFRQRISLKIILKIKYVEYLIQKIVKSGHFFLTGTLL